MLGWNGSVLQLPNLVAMFFVVFQRPGSLVKMTDSPKTDLAPLDTEKAQLFADDKEEGTREACLSGKVSLARILQSLSCDFCFACMHTAAPCFTDCFTFNEN